VLTKQVGRGHPSGSRHSTQRMAMGSAPVGYAAPENHQYPSTSKLGNRLRADFQTPISGWLTLEALPKKRRLMRHAGDNQSRGFSPNPITSYRHGSNLSKRPRHIELRMLLQHVITRSCQSIRLRLLAAIRWLLASLRWKKNSVWFSGPIS